MGWQQRLTLPLTCDVPAAYKAVGVEMTTPRLRAQMEADMRLIAEGQRDKESVVADCITTMRQIYQHVVSRAEELDRVLRHFLQPIGESK